MKSYIQHAIVIFHEDGQKTTIEPSGTVLLLSSRPQVEVCSYNAGDGLLFPVVSRQVFMDVRAHKGNEQVPITEIVKEPAIMVSLEVARFLYEDAVLRPLNPALQLYVPDTGPNSAVRDEKGVIVGVKRLVRYDAEI